MAAQERLDGLESTLLLSFSLSSLHDFDMFRQFRPILWSQCCHLLDQRLELLLTNAILRSVLELVYSLCDDRVVRPPYVNLHILGPCDIYAYSVN